MHSNHPIRNKIKPLWIVFSKRWGGPEQVVMSDMMDMVPLNIPIKLICHEGSPIHSVARQYSQIQIHTLTEASQKFFDLKFVYALRRTIEKADANLIHINEIGLMYYLVPALLGYPEISIIASQHRLVESQMINWLRSPFLGRLDFLMVLSEQVKASVVRAWPGLERKIKVINLGLDFSRFHPDKANPHSIRASWGADKETTVIGCVGRLSPEMGQATFIKATASLMKHKGIKFRIVIVGEEPIVASETYVGQLQSLVKQFNMDERVTFCSLDDNLPDLLAAFDIFVMAGREEVPGLGALEALAMQRPVVLSRIAGAEEIVDESRNGLLVRPEDAFDLQQKILTLLEQPHLRLSMGLHGRNYVLKHFDKQVRFLRCFGLYEKCMKRRFARKNKL